MWALIAIFIATISVANAHDNYPPLCCNGDATAGECKPIDCDSITETRDGYDWNGFHFKPKQVYPSFNKECHACVYRGAAPMCLFIQPSS